jgi:septum formation protein
MSKSKYKIILGSSSPRRKKIMEDVGFDFEIVTADIDEEAIRTGDYKQLPLLIARGKMEAVKKKVQGDCIIVCADTIVVCNGELREKPKSDEQMREWLESYAKYPFVVYTGIVVSNTKTGATHETIETGTIVLKPLPEELIQQLLKRDDFKSGSGAIIFDDPILHPYIKEYTNDKDILMGLSTRVVRNFIKELSEE